MNTAAILLLALSPFSHAQAGLEDAMAPAGSLVQQARGLGTSSLAAAPSGPVLTYEMICGGALKDAREKRRESGLRAVMPELRPKFEAIVKKYGLPALSGEEYIDPAINSVTFTYSRKTEQAKAAVAEFAEAIESVVLKRVALPDYGRIKADMISRIGKEPGLSADAKTELVRRVGLTDLVLPSKYIRDHITTTDELWPVISQLTQDQAWNASYEDLGGAGTPGLAKDQSVVIVYMGLLLADATHLDYVLLHETAHSIDSGRLPSLYDRYAGCMKQRHRTEFKGWDEVVADYWAVSALAQVLPRAGGPAQRLDYLRKSFELICDTSGEAGSIIIGMIKVDHPSGQYRIENVLGGEPDILRALSLPASQAPACRP